MRRLGCHAGGMVAIRPLREKSHGNRSQSRGAIPFCLAAISTGMPSVAVILAGELASGFNLILIHFQRGFPSIRPGERARRLPLVPKGTFEINFN
jgi:hypothetical protein